MKPKYSDDRSFTDFVHTQLAVPQVYQYLGWKEKKVDSKTLLSLDLHEGVDYIFENQYNKEILVQERFRDEYYKNYQDCTLRYRRDANVDSSRHQSEFYKVKADYLVYGITNGSKFPEKRHTLTHFLKIVVLDLKILFHNFDKGLITPKYGYKSSNIVDGKMIAPIIDNHDDSSSFVAFDVSQLHQLFGKKGIILFQKGFF
jgi:hypothetical protein